MPLWKNFVTIGIKDPIQNPFASFVGHEVLSELSINQTTKLGGEIGTDNHRDIACSAQPGTPAMQREQADSSESSVEAAGATGHRAASGQARAQVIGNPGSRYKTEEQVSSSCCVLPQGAPQ